MGFVKLTRLQPPPRDAVLACRLESGVYSLAFGAVNLNLTVPSGGFR